MTRPLVAIWLVAGLLSGAPASAQEPDPGPIMRVFLKDGQALPSFGESAQVADRLVFTLVIGEAGGSPQLQLVSLPVSLIDLDKTARYGESVRASRFGLPAA